MFDNILVVDVVEKDGLIFFNDNEEVLNSIEAPSDIELGFFNDFENLNEICDYIAEGAYSEVIIKFDVSLGLFARTLTYMLNSTDVKVIWLIENSIYSFCSVADKDIKIFNSCDNLNLYLLNKKSDMESIEKSELEKYFLKNKNYSETYKLIMTNGYIAYVTGLYPQEIIGSSTKHIHVNENVNLEEVINSLDINLNSAFLVDVKNYDTNLYEKTKRTKGLVSHVHQISEEKIYFDNSKYSINKKACSLKEYVELCKSNKVDPNEIYIVHINDNQDVSTLENILEQFKKTGEILNPNFYLADECRWVGRCDLNKFKRMNVIDKNIMPCNTSKTCLYNIDDDKFVKLAKINKEREKVQVASCSECKSNNICSKCICLPEGISREVFCKIINDFPYIQEYLGKRNLMLFLLKNSKLFKENKMDISSQAHPIIYTGTTSKYDPSHIIYLFSDGNKFYIYNFKNHEIVKIDEKLAFILEGYSISDETPNIIDNFKTKYCVDEECASNTVNTGMTLLRNMGVLI